jgi:hypothetical protein
MKTPFFTAVSAIAILAAVPVAFAADGDNNRTSNQNEINRMNEAEVEESWKNTKQSVKEGWENTKEATEEAYEDAKDALDINADSNLQASVTPTADIDTSSTANALLEQPVYNENGDRVAKIRDIIVDANGNANMVILGDGDFTGLGKLVAFNYSILDSRNAEGNVQATITEQTLASAASFSYDENDASGDVRVIPANGYSVSELLNAKLVDPENNVLADVDDISFAGGDADKIIVGYNQFLGLGGDQAAISFDEAELIRTNDEIRFRLSAQEAAQFEDYAETASR